MIYSHKWTDTLYEQVLDVIKDGKKPANQTVRKRSKYYHYDPSSDQIVYIHKGALPWSGKGKLQLLNTTKEHWFYVVRPSQKQTVLESYLQDPKLLTLGIYTLYDKIVKDKHLGISRSDVKAFLQSSQVVRMSRMKHVRPIKHSYLPEYPFQQWQMDLVDLQAFQKYNKKYSWILLIVDIFSKYTYGFPLVQKSANEIKASLEYVFLHGDIPERLQHDNEATFQSKEVSSLLKEMNVIQVVNDSYSPQTNGIVENKIKFLKRLIDSHFQTYRTYQWIDVLHRFLFNLNTTKHGVTGYKPVEIHRGRTMILNNKTLGQLELSEHLPEKDTYLQQKLKESQARDLYIQKEIKRKKDISRKPFWVPQIGDRVYLPYELKDSSGIVTFLLQRRDGPKVVKYQPDGILQLKKFRKKLVQRYYPQIFKVIQKGKDSERGPFYYTLEEETKKGIIEYMTDASKNKISTRFYPEQMFYISELPKKRKTYDYIDPVIKVPPKKLKQTLDMKKCPKKKWIGLKIKKAWSVDNKIEWYEGTIKKYSQRKEFKFDISYQGIVYKEDLLEEYYSKESVSGNWYFTQEEAFRKRCTV